MKDNEKAERERGIILKDLKDIGYELDYLVDLSINRDSYPDAIPVLIKHIEKGDDYHHSVLGNLYRLVACKWIKGEQKEQLIDLLFRKFKSCQDDKTRWVIGLALNEIVTEKKYLPDIMELLEDRKYREGRSELVHCYVRLAKKDSYRKLVEFLEQQDLMQASIEKVRRYKIKEAIPRLEIIAKEHEDPFFQDLAKDAIRKISK